MNATQRLRELGLELPSVTTPGGAYVPYRKVGDLIFTAGQLPLVDGTIAGTGILGDDVTTEEGARLAAICALNVLAIGAEVAGSLERISVVKATMFVASTPSFAEQANVANGASQRFIDVLGDAGQHARSAIGMASLPRHSPVEVEAVLHVHT